MDKPLEKMNLEEQTSWASGHLLFEIGSGKKLRDVMADIISRLNYASYHHGRGSAREDDESFSRANLGALTKMLASSKDDPILAPQLKQLIKEAQQKIDQINEEK